MADGFWISVGIGTLSLISLFFWVSDVSRSCPSSVLRIMAVSRTASIGRVVELSKRLLSECSSEALFCARLLLASVNFRLRFFFGTVLVLSGFPMSGIFFFLLIGGGNNVGSTGINDVKLVICCVPSVVERTRF